MDRVAVFVDAGYLFAQGSILLAGRKLTRGEIRLEHEKAIENLALFAERVSGVKLLRVYWYDGTSVGPTPQHHTLAYLPSVKVRLGFVNSVGEQKGV
ncbi:MAG: NYN domain-containing protein, partial [Longimicrobiaceae bacterium]